MSPALGSPIVVEPGAHKTRRLHPTTWASALALVLLVCGLGVALLDHAPPSPPLALELGAEVPLAAVREHSTSLDTAPAITRSPMPVLARIPVPAPVVAVATPAPPVATRELAPADARSVVELYQALAKELKTIADRRDLSADDLWQRYRRIRIQEALASSAKRAVVMNELAFIDRQLGKRFGTAPRAK